MKNSIIIIIILFILVLGIIGTYLIDMNRMKNNKEVIFSTWGYSYAPPVNLSDEKIENTNNLTLDKLKEMIAEKGANLTWSDFEDYSSNDVGFGLYIRLYKINEDYNLYIGGHNEKVEPLYIRLVSTSDENRFIDIREDNIDDFLNIKENKIIKTYSESVENHINHTYYKMSDGTWKTDYCSYKYRLEITGKMSNAAKDSTFVYLSNIEEISFEQAYLSSGLSSNMNDYFDLKDAILVEMY